MGHSSGHDTLWIGNVLRNPSALLSIESWLLNMDPYNGLL